VETVIDNITRTSLGAQVSNLSPRIPLNATARACCPGCNHRFPWPTDAPTTTESPLVRPLTCCPGCRLVVPVVEEACDEKWWTNLLAAGKGNGRRPRPEHQPSRAARPEANPPPAKRHLGPIEL